MAKEAELRAKEPDSKQPCWNSNLQRILLIEEMKFKEMRFRGNQNPTEEEDDAAAGNERFLDMGRFQLDCADLEAPLPDVSRTPSPRRREEERNSTRAATVVADSPEPQSPPERQSPPRYRMTNMVRAARIPGLENR